MKISAGNTKQKGPICLKHTKRTPRNGKCNTEIKNSMEEFNSRLQTESVSVWPRKQTRRNHPNTSQNGKRKEFRKQGG